MLTSSPRTSHSATLWRSGAASRSKHPHENHAFSAPPSTGARIAVAAITMTPLKTSLTLATFLLASACASSQKEPDGPVERAGEKVDEAAEDTKDAAEDAGDKIEEKTDKAESDDNK